MFSNIDILLIAILIFALIYGLYRGLISIITPVIAIIITFIIAPLIYNHMSKYFDHSLILKIISLIATYSITRIILSKVENTMEREIYIEKIAKGYNISKEAIYAEVNKLIYTNSKGDKILQNKKPEIQHIKKPEKEEQEIDEDLLNRENTIISLLLDSNVEIFNRIKEKIKPEDFKDKINRKIAEDLYLELEKQDANVNKLIDNFDEETKNHITMVMATDYEIENIEKAVEDILLKYEKERLNNRKKEILKQLEIEQNNETKKQLGKELNNIIIALAKMK